jgi:hypothetical protein
MDPGDKIYTNDEFHRHHRELRKNMHKCHTLQCKNNKLLLSNHHLLWRNIYTLWRSSSSVCDGEHKDITQFLLAHGDVALTNDMLKDYKVGKAYEYFSSGWLQEG